MRIRIVSMATAPAPASPNVGLVCLAIFLAGLCVYALWRWRIAINGWSRAIEQWGQSNASHRDHFDAFAAAVEMERVAHDAERQIWRCWRCSACGGYGAAGGGGGAGGGYASTSGNGSGYAGGGGGGASGNGNAQGRQCKCSDCDFRGTVAAVLLHKYHEHNDESGLPPFNTDALKKGPIL